MSEQNKKDSCSASFRREVDALIRQDYVLLKRVANEDATKQRKQRFQTALKTVNRRHGKTLKRLAD